MAATVAARSHFLMPPQGPKSLLNDLYHRPVPDATFCSKTLYYPNCGVRRLHGGEKEKMKQEDAYSLARAVLLIGGIVALAFGATEFGNQISNTTNFAAAISRDYTPLLTVIVGVAALVTSSRIKDEPIAIIMAVLGFLAGGLGGVLVAIGGVWALITRYTIKAS